MTGSSTEKKEESVTRRSFIKYLLGISVFGTFAGVLAPILSYLWPPAYQSNAADDSWTSAGALEDYPVGVGKVMSINNKPVIVVNTEQGMRAFSGICTHLGCVVLDKEPGLGYISCPCHDGRFSAVNGAVIGGPPPRPLPAYELRIEGTTILVGKPLGQLYGT